MPHTVTAATAKLAPGLGVSRGQPVLERKRAVRKHVSTRTSSASGLTTAPVLTEFVKLTLSPSSVTNANTVAAGMLTFPQQNSHSRYAVLQLRLELCYAVPAVSQAVGPNYLVWYGILCALTASVGTWVVHFTSYLWHTVFEGYILQEKDIRLKVVCQHHKLHSVPAAVA